VTRIYYDTEFLERGPAHPIELISIGMVRDDGTEYYAVAADAPWERITEHAWLMANVMPSLPKRLAGTLSGVAVDFTDPRVKPRSLIAEQVKRFVLGSPNPELWAWYGAYDHVVLAQLFGRMVDLPTGFPMWTNDLRQEVARLGDPQLPEQPSGLHNALADARHLKARAEWLDQFAAEWR